jgi:hypothetical protein
MPGEKIDLERPGIPASDWLHHHITSWIKAQWKPRQGDHSSPAK